MKARRAEPALAYSAAAILGAAGVLGTVESALALGAMFSPWAGIAALPLAVAALTLGPRLPRSVMFLFAPAGVLLIGIAMATTEGYSDAAILYCWPILWVASFYGSRATASVIALVAVVHAAALCACSRGATGGSSGNSPPRRAWTR